MRKYVFTDTNLFEQFGPISDIDWPKLASCEQVTLLVPSVTIRELNDHKDSGMRGRLRRKAASALVQLRKYADGELPISIRKGVDLDFRPNEPLIEFEKFHLDPRLNDDRLLASAIDFAIEQKLPRESVLVTTGDFGLELKARSQNLISPLALPEELRLPEELDPDEKRIKELESQLRSFQSAAPELRVLFDNGATFAHLEIRSPEVMPGDMVSPTLTQLRAKYPYLAPSPAHPPGWIFSPLGESYCQNYNDKLNAYFRDSERWMENTWETRNWHTLHCALRLFLHNDGGTPGEDIDVRVHVPDGCDVVKAADVPRYPEKPAAPEGPAKSIADLVSGSIVLPRFDFPDIRLPNLEVKNARMLSIRRGRSYDVDFHVGRLKHTYSEELPSVHLHFPSYEDAKSFRLEYRIVAGNHPVPVTGVLDAVIEKK